MPVSEMSAPISSSSSEMRIRIAASSRPQTKKLAMNTPPEDAHDAQQLVAERSPVLAERHGEGTPDTAGAVHADRRRCRVPHHTAFRNRQLVTINRPREEATTLGYAIGVDADDATADADGADHGGTDGTDGTLILAAGESEAAIEFTVHDDSDIEPPRETLVVRLERPATPEKEYGLGLATASVTIAGGVCDRTAQVRSARRRSLPCTAVSETDLGGTRLLDLADRGIATLGIYRV